MRKKVVVMLLSLCASLLCLFGVACKEKDLEDKPTVTITLSETELSLDLFERKPLSATANTQETIFWEIENSDVAEWKDGMVIAKSEGTTKVVAQIGKTTAECIVTVRDSGEKIQVDIQEDTINLFANDTYRISTEVTYKGKPFPYVTYEVQSADPTVFEANGLEVTAKDSGATTAIVRVNYYSTLIVEKTLIINIVGNYNIITNATKNTINLVTNAVDKENYADEFVLDIGVEKDQVALPNANVQVTVEDEDICTYDAQNCSVKALKIGTTKLLLCYTEKGIDYKSHIVVNVDREYIAKDVEFVFKSGGELDLSLIDIEAKDVLSVSDITAQKTLLAWKEATDTQICVESASIGERKILISTEEKDYACNAVVATRIIANREDFKTFMTYVEANKLTVSDYVVVTADIDMEGFEANNSGWFMGVLDGRGHIVKNYISYVGLRSNSSEGIVKNIGLEFTVPAWVSQYTGVLVRGQNNTKYENVYINVKYETTNEYEKMAILGDTLTSSTSFHNCVIVLECYGDTDVDIYADYVNKTTTSASITNTYIITKTDLKVHEEAYTNAGLYIVETASDIQTGTLDGLFHLENGAYFFGQTPILCTSEEQLVYKNNISSISKTLLNGEEIEEVELLGNKVVFSQTEDQLILPASTFLTCKENQNYIVKVTTQSDIYYVPVWVEEYSFEVTKATKQFVTPTTPVIDLAVAGVDGNVEVAYLKNSSGELLYSVANNELTITSTLISAVEYTLIVQTINKQYEIPVLVADIILRNETDFASYIKNIPDNTYAILTADLDMKGQDLTSTKASSLINSTLDGGGHIVKNFTTSALLTTTGVQGNGACLRNIGLDFTFTAVRNGGIYVTTDMAWCTPGAGYDYTTENVWMNVKLTGTAYNTTIFGQRVRGNVYKNVVINIELVEGTTQTGSLYADYNTTNTMNASTLTNVYVIDQGNICQQHTDYGWNSLTKVTSVSGVTTIGGLFEQKSDGLYFNGTKVLDK